MFHIDIGTTRTSLASAENVMKLGLCRGRPSYALTLDAEDMLAVQVHPDVLCPTAISITAAKANKQMLAFAFRIILARSERSGSRACSKVRTLLRSTVMAFIQHLNSKD